MLYPLGSTVTAATSSTRYPGVSTVGSETNAGRLKRGAMLITRTRTAAVELRPYSVIATDTLRPNVCGPAVYVCELSNCIGVAPAYRTCPVSASTANGHAPPMSGAHERSANTNALPAFGLDAASARPTDAPGAVPSDTDSENDGCRNTGARGVCSSVTVTGHAG